MFNERILCAPIKQQDVGATACGQKKTCDRAVFGRRAVKYYNIIERQRNE